MSKKCQVTSKRANNAYAISHSHVRTKRLQNVNLQTKRIWSKKQSCWVRIRISAKAIKNIAKLGI